MMDKTLSQSSSRGITPHDLINPGRGISSKIGLALLALGLLLPYSTLKAAVGSQVAARFNHSIAVKSDGTVWTWGNNSNGQLGNGSTSQSTVPIAVSGLSSSVMVAAGYFHSLSLSSDGLVKAWGANSYGQIGDGGTTQRTTPVAVPGVSDIVELRAGYAHSVALKADGTVWAWGLNNSGQIGDGTTTQRNSPVQVPSLSGVISISAGFYHNLALKADGTVWAWGSNTNGQIGDGTTTQRNSPVRVGTLDGVSSLAAGLYHSLALKTDGTVRSWGGNSYGQLGDGTVTQRTSPVVTGTLSNMVSVTAAFGSSMFLRADGTVWGCGMNSNGQLGDGTTIQRNSAVQTVGLTNVAALTVGNSHSLAVKADGTVWTWGFNVNGQLGLGNTNGRSTPGQITVVSGILAAQVTRTKGAGRSSMGTSVSGGEFHSLSLNSRGEVWAWGDNDQGQVGDGTTVKKPLPTRMVGMNGVAVVAAGKTHSLALKSNGTVWAWGSNTSGQLGDGTTTARSFPVQITGLTGIVAIAAGDHHSIALKSNGTVWVWGANSNGQLGDGSTLSRLSPVSVTGLSNIISLSAGGTHSLAVRADGTVWCWGANLDGRLGDGSTIQRITPVQIAGFTGVVAVAGGASHSLALKANGTVWAWGANARGQLGNNSLTPSVSPLQISSLSGIVSIAAGRNHGAALTGNGLVRIWGANESGQAGVGSLFDQITPVQIPDLVNVLALTAGFDHNLVLTMDGCISGWGRNDTSQLGDQSTIERTSPIRVIGLTEVASLSVGANHTVALKSNGTLAAWGYNDFGQLGGGTEGLQTVPSTIPALGASLSVAAGERHTLFVKDDNTVWACGTNVNGQLGDGTLLQRPTPVQVTALTGISRVAVGSSHSMALAADGTVWTWGANTSGQLGTGDTVQRSMPTQVPGLTDVTEIACGISHSLALKEDGTLWAWGGNTGGQLGTGTTIQRNAPVQVSSMNQVTNIAAGGNHSVALTQNQSVWTWGTNSQGQLGNGTTTANPNPTVVSGLANVISISAGANHTVALLLDGSLWTWGANACGQLGDGTRLGRLSPVLVAGNYGRDSTVAAGGDKTYMIKEDGTLFAWGVGAFGELANAFASCRFNLVTALGCNRVNPVPTLEISSPPSPADVVTGQNVAIELDTTITSGQVTNAYFYADGILLREDQAAPFTFDYSPETWGDVDINAVVVSASGAISAPASLSLKTPFDNDQDGFPDWWEIRNGQDPNTPDEPTSSQVPIPQAIPLPLNGINMDQDGIDDAWELTNGLDPNCPLDASLDFDRDGHTNLQEFGLGTDPRGAPHFRLREVDSLQSLSEVKMSPWVLGDGMMTLSSSRVDSVYFMGTPSGSGQRPIGWSVMHGATAGVTLPYKNELTDEYFDGLSLASGGAALAYIKKPGAAADFYYWRSPSTPPIFISGATQIHDIGFFLGYSFRDYLEVEGDAYYLSPFSLSTMGNFVVGRRQNATSPYSQESIVWKMPLMDETRFSPIVLHSPPWVNLPMLPKLQVNDQGFVAATGKTGGKNIAVLWKVNDAGTDASSELLPLPPSGVSSSIAGISNEIEPLIVGRSMSGTTQEKATAWRRRPTGTFLEDLQIPPDVGFSAAAAVSQNGQVVAGTCRLVQDPSKIFVFAATFKPSTATWRFQLQGPPVFGAEIIKVNDFGEIFGNSTTIVGQRGQSTLWRHGKGHLLTGIIPAHTGHEFSTISAINEQGALLATTFKDDTTMKVILTPDPDTDGDGLPDAFENQYQLDPFLASDPAQDSDNDLLSDLDEFRNGTSPRNPDSDGDGMKDGWEISWGFLPLDPSDAALDPDNDGVTNHREFQIGTTPTGSYRVVHRYRYPEASTLDRVYYADDLGNLVFNGEWETNYQMDPNGYENEETFNRRWLLPPTSSAVVPLYRSHSYHHSQAYKYEQVNYGTNYGNGTLFGLLRREDRFLTNDPNLPFMIDRGGHYLIPEVANNSEDESTWTILPDMVSNLRDPDMHGGTAPLGPDDYFDIHSPDAVSPSGTKRIGRIQSAVPASLVLDAHGGFERRVEGGAIWRTINDLGIAARVETPQLPALEGEPVLSLWRLRLTSGDTFEIPLPRTTSANLGILSFSNDGKALLCQSKLSAQFQFITYHFLFDTITGELSRVRGSFRYPYLYSLTNGRLLFPDAQITPDGTRISLRSLRIKNSPTDEPEPFGTLYPDAFRSRSPLLPSVGCLLPSEIPLPAYNDALTPIHISSSGTITVAITNAQNQTDILQIIPDNDADNDDVPDDWEIAFNSPNGTGDQDSDGLSDADEFVNGGNPHNTDTDGDGMFDGVELAAGFNITDRDENRNGESDGYEDIDNDGYVNFVEVLAQTNSSDPARKPDGVTTDTLVVTGFQVEFKKRSGGAHKPSMGIGFEDTPLIEENGGIAVGQSRKHYLSIKTSTKQLEKVTLGAIVKNQNSKSTSADNHTPVLSTASESEGLSLNYDLAWTGKSNLEYSQSGEDPEVSLTIESNHSGFYGHNGQSTSNYSDTAKLVVGENTSTFDYYPYHLSVIHKIHGWDWPYSEMTTSHKTTISPTTQTDISTSTGPTASSTATTVTNLSNEYTDSNLKSHSLQILASRTYQPPRFLWEPHWSRFSYSSDRSTVAAEDIRYNLTAQVPPEIRKVIFVWREVTKADPSPGAKPIQHTKPVDSEVWYHETVQVQTTTPNSPISTNTVKTEARVLLHPADGGVSYPTGAPESLLSTPSTIQVDRDTRPSDAYPRNLYPISFNVGAEYNKQNVVLETNGTGSVKLWKRQFSGSKITAPASIDNPKYEPVTLPHKLKVEQKAGEVSRGEEFFLQGVTAGNLTLSLKLGGIALKTSSLEIVDLDLDVDSDNSGEIDGSASEDQVEANSNEPGKIILTNGSSQSDENGIPLQPDKLAGLKIKTANLQPGEEITLTYPTSALRIWKTSPSQTPTQDDLLEPGTYSLSELGLSSNSTTDFSIQSLSNTSGLSAINVKCGVAQDLTLVSLLPVEVAPDVLAVNSDFDEGRIDPLTGYAIPDCDDTNIALEAVKNHLDGKFATNDRVTDDMHPGFFGVNPSNLDNDFWTGAIVTIRKIEKNDPATGHPESGHIRLYGKWGDGASEYRAIVPYNFETLATANLATGGINGTSESVYGAASPFPDGTSYFIEGVHPGKITLEWRYQKGSVDFKHEQSFRVYTKKTAQEWRFDLDYKIRLETSNDPSGEIRTLEYPLLSYGYTANIERAAEFYDFYRECFHEPLRSFPTGYPNAMSWPGLARLAGSQVIGGLSDSEWGKTILQGTLSSPMVYPFLHPRVSRWSISEIEQLQLALFQGGWQIFASAGWQHQAFRSSGYEAIEWVANNTSNPDAPEMLEAWQELRQGALDHDKALIDGAAEEITNREQNHTIVPTWTVISGLGVGLVDDMFSILGTNSCTPTGLNFTELFDVASLPPSTPPKPLGNLADAADRWEWIHSGTSGGILETWNTQPMARKLSLSGDSLKSDAMRFSTFSNVSPLIPILSWDDADIP